MRKKYLLLKENSERVFFNADSRKSNADTRRFIDFSICANLRYICDHLRSRRFFQEPLKKLGAISAQSVIEYLVILTVILAAILSTGFMGRIRQTFNTYFTTAAGKIVTTH